MMRESFTARDTEDAKELILRVAKDAEDARGDVRRVAKDAEGT